MKRSDERRNEVVIEASRLQAEISVLRDALSTARTDVERFYQVRESLFEKELLLSQVSRQFEDQKTFLRRHESTISEQSLRIDSLLHQIQTLESASSSLMQVHQSTVKDYESKIQLLQSALQESEKGRETNTREGQLLQRQLLDRDEQLTQKELRIVECERTISEQAERVDALLQVVHDNKADYESLMWKHQSTAQDLNSKLQSLQEAIQANGDNAERIQLLEKELLQSEQQNSNKQLLFEECTKQLDAAKKELVETQNTLKESQSKLQKVQKTADAANSTKETTLIKLLAIAAENDALRQSNEELVLQLEQARRNSVLITNENQHSKEPPSLGYMWRKLKHHHFYGPFIGRAIRNSLGLRRSRKAFRQ